MMIARKLAKYEGQELIIETAEGEVYSGVVEVYASGQAFISQDGGRSGRWLEPDQLISIVEEKSV
jgi:hypothetical protein